jgi:Icc-related predicted phosphoesterase
MKIIHISDNHSYFFPLPKEGEVVIHSGDLLPNFGRPIKRHQEIRFQTEWVKTRIETFKEWLDGRPFYFCEGNHDFINPVHILKEAGIEAFTITNEPQRYLDQTIFGIPYIPFIAAEWNWELTLPDMQNEFLKFDQYFNSGLEVYERMPSILVCHAPPSGILSDVYGNSILSNFISYVWKDKLPKILLTGHVHNQGNKEVEVFGMRVSNAACCARLIEI